MAETGAENQAGVPAQPARFYGEKILHKMFKDSEGAKTCR